MSLSPAATIVLTRAAERHDRRLEFHRKLPTGGRHKGTSNYGVRAGV